MKGKTTIEQETASVVVDMLKYCQMNSLPLHFQKSWFLVQWERIWIESRRK